MSSAAAQVQPEKGIAVAPSDPSAAIEVRLPAGMNLFVGEENLGTTRQLRLPVLGDPYSTKRFIGMGRKQSEVGIGVLLKPGWKIQLNGEDLTPDDEVRALVGTGHVRRIRHFQANSQGTQFVTGGEDGRVILWDTERRIPLRDYVNPNSRNEVYCVAVSDSGERIVAVRYDRVEVYDTCRGVLLRELRRKDSGIPCAVDISADETTILAVSTYCIEVWQSGESEPRVISTGRNFDGFLSADGQMFATANSNGVSVWDVENEEKKHSYLHHTAPVVALEVSSDQETVYSADEKGNVHSWSFRNGTGARMLTLPSRITSLGLASDDSTLICACSNRRFYVVDVETRRITSFDSGYGRYTLIRPLEFIEASDQVIAVSKYARFAQIWNTSGESTFRMAYFGSPIYDACATKDLEIVATGHRDGSVAVWNLRSGIRARRLAAHTSYITTVSIDSDGSQMLTGAHDKLAKLWDLKSLHVVREYKERFWPVNSAFGTDGEYGIWNVTNELRVEAFGSTAAPFTGFRIPNVEETGAVRDIAYSSSARRLLIAHSDARAAVWDLTQNKTVQLFRNPRGTTFNECRRAAMSADGRTAVIGVRDGEVLVWDADHGKVEHALRLNTGPCTALALGDSDRLLAAAGGNDCGIRLWNMADGELLRQFYGHTSAISALSFSGDGRYLVSSSTDGSSRLWDNATGLPLATLFSFRNSDDWLVVTPSGLFDGSEGGMQKVMFRIGDGLNVVPVSRFFRDFYYPGLLAEIWRGERPVPALSLKDDVSVPPTIRILDPETDGPVAQDQVAVTVEVTSAEGGVGPLRLRQNGAIVAAIEPDSDSPVFRRTFRVQLVEGENRLRVESFNRDGSFESEPATRTLHYDQSLPKPNLYVIAVGVSEYAEDSLKLSYAARDAQAMAELFRRRAGALYEKTHITQLLNQDATKQRIRDAIRKIAERAREQDTLLVHFSGHGVTVDQRYFFVPQDFRHQSRRFENDVEDTGYPGDQLARHIGEVKALKKILILDTCNSGAGLSLSHVKRRNPWAFAGAIRRLSRERGIHILAAAASDGDTIEIHDLRHGVLTYSLLNGMQAADANVHADANQDGLVSVLEWFSFAAERVPQLTSKYLGREQNVQVQGEGGIFPVLPVLNPESN